MAGFDLPLRAIREQIASAFDLVIQISRFVDGTRRVTHVTEVLRMESDVITLQDLFLAKPGSGPARPTGIRPHFADKLAASGVVLPVDVFDPSEPRLVARAWRRISLSIELVVAATTFAVAALVLLSGAAHRSYTRRVDGRRRAQPRVPRRARPARQASLPFQHDRWNGTASAAEAPAHAVSDRRVDPAPHRSRGLEARPVGVLRDLAVLIAIASFGLAARLVSRGRAGPSCRAVALLRGAWLAPARSKPLRRSRAFEDQLPELLNSLARGRCGQGTGSIQALAAGRDRRCRAGRPRAARGSSPKLISAGRSRRRSRVARRADPTRRSRLRARRDRDPASGRRQPRRAVRARGHDGAVAGAVPAQPARDHGPGSYVGQRAHRAADRRSRAADGDQSRLHEPPHTSSGRLLRSLP